MSLLSWTVGLIVGRLPKSIVTLPRVGLVGLWLRFCLDSGGRLAGRCPNSLLTIHHSHIQALTHSHIHFIISLCVPVPSVVVSVTK